MNGMQIAPPAPEAYHGLAGALVEAFDPHTEADPVAVLAQTLVLFGVAVGLRPFVRVGAEQHRPREFLCIVGATSHGRKGTSASGPMLVLGAADPNFRTRIRSGLASGEALIAEVRDEAKVWDEKREVYVIKDPGTLDKRLLLRESEFARLLRTMKRDGNTASAVLRDAWDSGDLAVTARTTGIVATGAHVSLVAHCTPAELQRETSDLDAANGLLNRFCFALAGRSKLLPDPEPFAGPAVNALAGRFADALSVASQIDEMRRDAKASTLWKDIYPQLTADRPGLAGQVLARAEAHALRLSMIYALIDGSPLIRIEHLRSALATWAYFERSVAVVFGDKTGDGLADQLRELITKNPGQKRTDLHNALGRHQSGRRIDEALRLLVDAGLASSQMEATAGRPAERYYPVRLAKLSSLNSLVSQDIDGLFTQHRDEVVRGGGEESPTPWMAVSSERERSELSEKGSEVSKKGFEVDEDPFLFLSDEDYPADLAEALA